MKTGSILTECAVIVAVAVVLGTAVHLSRPEKLRIKFIEDYQDAWKIRESEPPAPPVPREPASGEPPSEGVKAVDRAKNGKQEDKKAAPAAGSAVKSDLPEIGVEEAFRLFEIGDTPFLDARRTRFYVQGHIPRAKAMSVWEADLDKRISDLLNELPLDITMVIYCSGGDCEDSHMLAGKLKQAGFTSLQIFTEGYPKWVEKNHPVEKGEADGRAPAGGDESK